MLGMSCRTSSSSSSGTSPPHMNSLSSLHRWLPKNILNTSPRLSSNFKNIIPFVMPAPNRASLLLPSDKDMAFVSTDSNDPNASLASKSYAELEEEILTLELEIMHLERYLRSLYRTALEDCMPTISSKPVKDLVFTPLPLSKTVSDQQCYKIEPHMKRAGLIQQAQAYPTHYWSSSESQNLSHGRKPKFSMNRKNTDTGHRSLADHFGVPCIDDSHSPDRLSEDIMRCISSIYCNLARSSQKYGDFSSSPTSSLSSSIFSSKNPLDNWSPKCKDHASVHWLQESKRITGERAAMVEITKILIDDKSFNYVTVMLQNFRSLVRDLEKVDPMKMKRELACILDKCSQCSSDACMFPLIAYLAYGICNRARNTSILKAAYNVGGHCINAFDIQSSILGIRSDHSAPWLQALFYSGRKLKTGIISHPYALEYPEPLVHFALCSGSNSDPVVRVYRAKNIFEDLKRAKEEFIRDRVKMHNQSKISMPKMLYDFGKDMALSMEGVMEILSECSLSEAQRRGMRRWVRGRPGKKIEWIQYSSSFRYVIHGDLAGLEPTQVPFFPTNNAK